MKTTNPIAKEIKKQIRLMNAALNEFNENEETYNNARSQREVLHADIARASACIDMMQAMSQMLNELGCLLSETGCCRQNEYYVIEKKTI